MGIIPEEMQEMMSEHIIHDDIDVPSLAKEEEEDVVEDVVEDVEEETSKEEPVEIEEVEDEKEEVEAPKLDLEKLARKAEEHEYVSKFEKLMDNSSKQQDRPKRRNKRRKDFEEEDVLSNKELEEKLRNKIDPELMPTYTEEELEEIERMEEEEELSQYDIDYDEYEDFYLDEEQGK